VLGQTEAGIAEEREILTAEREQFCRDRVFQESELRRFGMELPSPDIATMIADLTEKIAKTGIRLAELDEQLENLESEHISETDVPHAFGDFDQLWRTFSSRQQAKLISRIVERVEDDAGKRTMAICFQFGNGLDITLRELSRVIAASSLVDFRVFVFCSFTKVLMWDEPDLAALLLDQSCGRFVKNAVSFSI
jgi:hypothetical protein